VKGKTPKWDARDVIAIVIAAIAIITLFLLPISVLPLAAPVASIVNGLVIALVLRARR
jgi:hypothetical protein